MSGESRVPRDTSRGHPAGARTRSLATTWFRPGFALRSLPYPTPRWSAGYDSAHKWLDGISDALCMSPSLASGLAPLRHCGNTLAPTPTQDYRPSLRSPWPAASAFARKNVGQSTFGVVQSTLLTQRAERGSDIQPARSCDGANDTGRPVIRRKRAVAWVKERCRHGSRVVVGPGRRAARACVAPTSAVRPGEGREGRESPVGVDRDLGCNGTENLGKPPSRPQPMRRSPDQPPTYSSAGLRNGRNSPRRTASGTANE